SSLSNIDVKLSVDYPFSGHYEEKHEIHQFTSLTLFVDDIQRVIYDLFGEFDGEAIRSVMQAVWAITCAFTQYACKDLWKEQYYASEYELDEAKIKDRAESYLAKRAFEVRRNPGLHSKYTIEFISVIDEYFDLPSLKKLNKLALVKKSRRAE